jgi:hypothetical protein
MGAKTDSLLIGTGVARIWARAASTMVAGARAAAELSGGCFILGIGTNNPAGAAMRGLSYCNPVTYMRISGRDESRCVQCAESAG